MNNYENENLEFERLNGKIDFLYDMISDLLQIVETQESEDKIRRAEKELEKKQFDLDIAKNRHETRSDVWEYRRKNWRDINRVFNERKNGNSSCTYEVTERY